MVVRLISAGFTGFIVYTAWSAPSLLAWHPAMIAIAFGFIMVQSILVFSTHSSMIPNASHTTKVRCHYLGMLLAVACAFRGLLASGGYHDAQDWEHMTSLHGKIGAATVLYLLTQASAGFMQLFPSVVAKIPGVSVREMRGYHAMSGMVLFLLVCISLILGMNSDWFTSKVTGYIWHACIASPLMMALVVVMQVSSKYIMKNK